MQANKINFVRIWVHGRGNNTPAYDSNGFTLSPTQDFYDDLEFIINLATAKKIYVNLNMWSFDMVLKNGAGQPGSTNFTAHRNTILDDNKTTSYLNNFLAPVVNLYKDNPYVLAFEVINEPEAIWENENNLVDGTIDRDQVITFIAKAAAKIHQESNNKKMVTVGSKWMVYNSSRYSNFSGATNTGDNFSDASLQNQFNSTDAYLDFYSMHWYQWQSTGAPFNESVASLYPNVTKPIIVAEYPGLDLPNNDCGCTCTNPGVCNFNITLINAYKNIKTNNFAGISAWRNGLENDNFGKSAKIYEATLAFANANPNLVNPTATPDANTGLVVSNITNNSFTLTWDKNENATDGTNIFIVDDTNNSGDIYITTVSKDVNSFEYLGSYGSVTLQPNTDYTLKLQALPDADGNAYSQISTTTTNTLSINDFKALENQISVFPNPVTSIFSIKNNTSQAIKSITISNSLGQTLISKTTKTINLEKLNQGVYFVSIKLDNAIVVKQIIKK
jgi:hypothetical protein